MISTHFEGGDEVSSRRTMLLAHGSLINIESAGLGGGEKVGARASRSRSTGYGPSA
ncbi:hypothetical protein [Miltoncostaea oceani]|uniref:hypothetical protein n=1 Tax=Miltoncostaea oceani TaxID=2843216 RepID=UPI001C3CD602|nr:hypothetical protein [Miltoncostaea oceani]